MILYCFFHVEHGLTWAGRKGGAQGAAKDGEEFDDGVPGRKNSSSFGLSIRRETLGLGRWRRFTEERGVGVRGFWTAGRRLGSIMGQTQGGRAGPGRGLQDGGRIRKQQSINPSN